MNPVSKIRGQAPTQHAEDHFVTLVREVFLIVTTVVIAGFAAIVLFPPDQPPGRIVVLAVACGIVAAALTDWRSATGLILAAGFVFVVFLASQPDGQPDPPAPVSYTPLIGLAVLLGQGYRSLTAAHLRTGIDDAQD